MSLLLVLSTTVCSIPLRGSAVLTSSGLHHVNVMTHRNVSTDRYSAFVNQIGGKKLDVGRIQIAKAHVNDKTLAWIQEQSDVLAVLSYTSDAEGEYYGKLDCPLEQTGVKLSWGLVRTTQEGKVEGSKETPKGSFKHDKNWGKGVAAYIVDSGVRPTHEDFVDTGVVCRNSVPLDCSDDIHRHGTPVASQVAGKSYGIAKSATLISLSLDDASMGNFAERALVNWAYLVEDCNQRKAAGTETACLCTNSFGIESGGMLEIMLAAIKEMKDQGVLVVAAAGNTPVPVNPTVMPAGSPDAFRVGATLIGDNAASYSTYGENVEIWAPSCDTKAASSQSDDAETYFGGTSSACPHVAGVAAVHFSENPSITNEQVEKLIIKQSLKDVLDLSRQPESHNRLLHIPCSSNN